MEMQALTALLLGKPKLMGWEVGYIVGLVWTQWQRESWMLAGTETQGNYF
jgi:hypothetical protein